VIHSAQTAADIIRPWISTGFLGGILIAVSRYGKPVSDYLIETAKIRAQTKKDDRQGYGGLIEALSKEVAALREENAALRGEVRQLHGLIDGIRRGDLQARTSAQVIELHALPAASIPPATAASLERMEGKSE